MAGAAVALVSADYGIATTGVAGPDELEETPVGTVCIAVVRAGQPPLSATMHFEGDRDAVRRQATESAMAMLLAA